MAKKEDEKLVLGLGEDNLETSLNGGVLMVKCTDKNLFFSGTDIPKATFAEVDHYNKAYITAVTTEMAEYAKTKMLDDNEIKQVVCQLPYGTSARSRVNVDIRREQEFRNNQTNEVYTGANIRVNVRENFHRIKPVIKSLKDDLTAALLR